MSGTGGFQTQVYDQPVMAIPGDFASNNPWFSFDAGPGGLVAGAGGVTIGKFAWVQFPPAADGTPAIAFNSPLSGTGVGGLFGPPSGFVHRAQQGLITTYLAFAGMLIQPGFQMGIMTGGDFWVANGGSTDAQMGQKAFASIIDGSVSFAAPGSVPSGASGATTAIATETFTCVGSITGNILTTASVSSGGAYPGTVLSSNGVGTIVKILSGSPTGVGTFLLSMGEQSVPAGTTIGGSYGEITFGTVTNGPFAVGMVLAGTGVVTSPPTQITYSLTGGATSGTMVVSNSTVVSSTTITGASAIETRWWAQSTGLAGELVKMTDHNPGFVGTN